MSYTTHYKVSILGALISSIAFTALAVFAIAPGETLDPVNTHSNVCPNGPTDASCIINPYDGLGADRILYLDGNGDITTDANFLRDENSFYIAGEMGIDEIGEFMIGEFTSSFGTYSGIGFRYEYGADIVSTIGIINTGQLGGQGIIGMAAEDSNTGMLHYLNIDPDFGITIDSSDSQSNERSLLRSRPDGIDMFYLGGNTANRIEVDVSGIKFQQIPDVNNPNITTGYTFPMVDGTVGQVLQTDGAGQLSWTTISGGSTLNDAYNFGGPGLGASITADDGAVSISGDGLKVTGSFGVGAVADLDGSGVRMFFNPAKAAFRAGGATGDSLDNDSLGIYSTAFGLDSWAYGSYSFAAGQNSSAFGNNAVALGSENTVDGFDAVTVGTGLSARAFRESVFGSYANYANYYNIDSQMVWFPEDRLFTIGNGSDGNTRSDAFTVLKSGEVGIAIDNFDTNTNSEIFQVGDGGNNIIGYVDSMGAWQTSSDKKFKTNIRSLSYGLDTINALSPKKYDLIRNGETTIGFIAQEVLDVLPDVVGGSEETGYSISYASFAPVLVKAIQELDLKVSMLESQTIASGGFSLASLTTLAKDFLGDIGNGIQNIFAKKITIEELCVENVCFDKEEAEMLKQLIHTGVITDSDDLEEEDIIIDDENIVADEEFITDEDISVVEEEAVVADKTPRDVVLESEDGVEQSEIVDETESEDSEEAVETPEEQSDSIE